MSTAEKTTGVPSALLRIGGFVPTIMAGARTFQHYELLKNHPELEQAPYNKHTIGAQYASAIAGIFCFLWCMLSFLFTLFSPPSATFVIGCVDFAFAIVLVVASGLQGAYLPHTKGACHEAESWQVPEGTPSLFQAISNFPGNEDSAEAICKEYFTTWCILVAVAVLWTLSAFLNMLLGGSMTKWTAYEFRYLWIAPINVLRLIFFPLGPFFPRFYYIWRYSLKFLQRIRDRYGPSLTLSMGRNGRRSGTDIGLAKVLSSGQPTDKTNASEKSPLSAVDQGNYDIMALISHQLHHIDIINLSLTSKRVHKAVFPKSMLDNRSQRLRLYACDDDTKSLCWACSTQICKSCKGTRKCTDAKASFHLTMCRAFCSSCYYADVCKYPYRGGQCECIIRTFNPSYQSLHFYSHRWLSLWAKNPSHTRQVCRSCNELTKDELLARQNKRGAVTIRQLANQSLACEKCRTSLPSKGPRWWICKDCRRECHCDIHPPWAPKEEV